MRKQKESRFTFGLLAGWALHRGSLDTFLHQVFCGVRAAAQELDCNLLAGYGLKAPRDTGMGHPAWPLLKGDSDFVPVGPWNCDGLIVAAPVMDAEGREYFKGLLTQGYPLVMVGSSDLGPGVVADNESGVRQAMMHLIAHGHRRIAFVGCRPAQIETDSDGWLRLQSYLSCCREFGLAEDPALTAFGYHTIDGGHQAMAEILARGVPFSAVVASNDSSAVGAIDALREAGLSVPGDIAVIGFDDRLEARALRPQLTTVHYPMFEVGYQSVHLLRKLIRGEVDRDVMLRVPAQLVIRESCGCRTGVAMQSCLDETSAQPRQDGESFAPSASIASEALKAELTASLVRATFNESQRASMNAVRAMCGRLVAAFRASLVRGQPDCFHGELRQVLDRVVAYGDDLHGCQTALTTLRSWLPAVRDHWDCHLRPSQVEEMLHRARVTISEMMQRQYAQELLRQREITGEMNRMTSRLYVAEDEAEIYEVLGESLPSLGIRHAVVARFEAEGDDPAAHSQLCALLLGDRSLDDASGDGAQPAVSEGMRFPTRQFPPEGLYAADERLSLAVLPLLSQQGAQGYIAFDMGNLELCADIVWQLIAAVRSVRLYRRAREGRRLAEEANRLKSRFLSTVSHELRTPLNLISGLSDLLLRESNGDTTGLTETKREDLERIYVNAQHLDSLIRDVLDLARSEVGQLQLTREQLAIAEILEPVLVIGRQLTCEKDLKWQVEIPDTLPEVCGDATRLRQVALNLVNNAVKFTDAGTVTLKAEAQDGVVRIAVRDTGMGIPADEQVAIFDEFRQGTHTSARGYGGLGLGLAICKRLVEMHAGEIGVTSSGKDGAGSEFFFTLPAAKPPTDDPAPEALLSQLRLTRAVLLVDPAHPRPELADRLDQQGLAVVTIAVDADTAWADALRGESPDAIILGQGVVAANGGAVLNYLQRQPALRTTPVLFYALDRHSDRGTLLQVDFATKPMRQSQFADLLDEQGLLTDHAEADVSDFGKKILIVDDDPDMLALHTRVVESQSPNYRVLQAHDGRQALDIMHREHPDLILLDLMMPEVDGFEVLDRMQADESIQTIPVVVLTAQELTCEDMSRLNRGVVSVLSKGIFTVEETLQRVESVLRQRRKSVSEVQRFVLEAMAYIHTHYMDAISRDDIAAHVGLSARHLNRCFRKEVGVTPISYLNRYRIKEARGLLETGNMSITDIAMAVGFSSGGYFSRVFSQETGVSPLAYQRGESGNVETARLS